jgi:hypothetical protein
MAPRPSRWCKSTRSYLTDQARSDELSLHLLHGLAVDDLDARLLVDRVFEQRSMNRPRAIYRFALSRSKELLDLLLGLSGDWRREAILTFR